MMHTDILVKNPESMRQWLSKPEARLFMAWVQRLYDSAGKTLRESSDSVEIYRSQGRVESLGKILGAQDVVEAFLKQTTGGK